MKKKLYFFQVNYPYGKSAHIPYTAGQLVAFAFDDKDVKENFSIEKIFFLREDIYKVLSQIEDPAVVAFSSYIWNHNYNKTLAKLIKERFPECVIVFGGHHVAPGGDLLDECEYIDYLLHGEGEIIFRRLLRSILDLDKFEDIPGISLRTKDGIITNPEIISSECDFPSPYLNGYFDDIMRENPDIEFMGLIETSRGCPNSCAYCDWSNMKSKIRKFPLERISGEIEWIMNNKICVLGSADSNFGMFKRDEDITDMLVQAKKKTGYPIRFQTSYAKKSSKRVFDIGMKLEEADMNRGITLSFQSMNKEALKNIGRENISIDYYSELMNLYNNAGVATYTELILGLPGETYETLVDGIDELLNLGQHNSIYIHNCEWLPCSVMGQSGYIDQYKIKTSVIPLNQPHREPEDYDDIQEWSQVITSTYSMTSKDWKKMNLFSYVVQAFHHMGIMQFFALYLYNEEKCTYKEFYTALLEHFLSSPNTVGGKIFRKIDEYLEDVLNERGTLSCCDERFGRVQWPFEEYAYLCIIYELDKFYDETVDFLCRFDIDKDVFTDLLNFQRNIMKRPFVEKNEIHTGYNFIEYFLNILSGEKQKLEKIDRVIYISPEKFDSWEQFAKTVAWYGRKNGKNTYIKEARFEAE